MQKDKIPLHTALWAEIYEELINHGVTFPKKFDGVGAAYSGLCAIDKILKEYKVTT